MCWPWSLKIRKIQFFKNLIPWGSWAWVRVWTSIIKLLHMALLSMLISGDLISRKRSWRRHRLVLHDFFGGHKASSCMLWSPSGWGLSHFIDFGSECWWVVVVWEVEIVKLVSQSPKVLWLGCYGCFPFLVKFVWVLGVWISLLHQKRHTFWMLLFYLFIKLYTHENESGFHLLFLH